MCLTGPYPVRALPCTELVGVHAQPPALGSATTIMTVGPNAASVDGASTCAAAAAAVGDAALPDADGSEDSEGEDCDAMADFLLDFEAAEPNAGAGVGAPASTSTSSKSKAAAQSTSAAACTSTRHPLLLLDSAANY